MKKLIDIGKVSAIYPERCTARVFFDDREAVSKELFIGVRGSQNTKEYWMPAIGEQVLCVFLQNSTDGFILCSYYGQQDKKPVMDEKKRHVTFEDGTLVEYDSNTHTMLIKAKGAINIIADGDVHVTGDVIADGISLKNHTHTSSDGSTSTPVGG